MNIYLVSRTDHYGYDEYDSFVVYHSSEDEAKTVHPSEDEYPKWLGDKYNCWVDDLEKIKVKLIGKSKEGVAAGKVITSSFNAG